MTFKHQAPRPADLLSTTISTEFSGLFSKALNARFGDLTPTTTHRSVADQVLDAVALEVAASQEVPELIAV